MSCRTTFLPSLNVKLKLLLDLGLQILQVCIDESPLRITGYTEWGGEDHVATGAYFDAHLSHLYIFSGSNIHIWSVKGRVHFVELESLFFVHVL